MPNLRGSFGNARSGLAKRRNNNIRRNRVSRQRGYALMRPVDMHAYRHTLPPISIPFQVGPSGTSIRGFNLPGTTANQDVFGLVIQFGPDYFSLANRAGGSAVSVLDNYSNYQNIYDFVRIKKATVRLYFTANSVNATVTTGTPYLPVIQMAHDFDDSTVPVSSDIVPDYPGARIVQFGAPSLKDGCIKTSLVPRFSGAAGTAGSAGTSVTMGSKGQWINLQQSTGNGLPHYGVKLFADSQGDATGGVSNVASLGYVSVYVTLDLEYKGVR